jgi:hypothetical protein
MNDDYVTISVDVYDEKDQRVKVRKTLSVGLFIKEILREFPDLRGENRDDYGLYFKDSGERLDPGQSLADVGIQSGHALVFDRVAVLEPGRRPLGHVRPAMLRVNNAPELDVTLEWQPAIIGRADKNRQIMELLALDLARFGKSTSRRHAQITVQDGDYYLTGLSDSNPVYLNNRKLEPKTPQRLQGNDKIRLGKTGVTVTFIFVDTVGK